MDYAHWSIAFGRLENWVLVGGGKGSEKLTAQDQKSGEGFTGVFGHGVVDVQWLGWSLTCGGGFSRDCMC